MSPLENKLSLKIFGLVYIPLNMILSVTITQ